MPAPSYFVEPATDEARANVLSVLARNLLFYMEYSLNMALDADGDVTRKMWSDLGYPEWGQA